MEKLEPMKEETLAAVSGGGSTSESILCPRCRIGRIPVSKLADAVLCPNCSCMLPVYSTDA